jgi:magnesium chelatase subunit H
VAAARRGELGARTRSALERCLDDIAKGDIIVVTMLFMEDHIKAVLPALQARREHCDAMVGCMSAARSCA